MKKSDFWFGVFMGACAMLISFGIYEQVHVPMFNNSCGLVNRIEALSRNNNDTYLVRIQSVVKGDNHEMWIRTQNNYKIGDTIKIK